MTSPGDNGLSDRLSMIAKVLDSPPKIHMHGTGVWRTDLSCYEFLARNVEHGAKTIETGAGVSTILFTAWGCRHLCVVPDEEQSKGLLAYCAEIGVDTSHLSFDLRSSEWALPELAKDEEFDLFFIDGNHGFPFPIIDWYYGAGHLRKGGVVVLDDIQIPQVALLPDWYLDRDPRWERLEGTDKWSAYRRQSEGSLSEIQTKQPFITNQTKNTTSGSLQSRLRRLISN